MNGKILEGKKGIVFGVANNRSIAWAVAECAHQHGAEVGIGVQNERMADAASKLTANNADYKMYIADMNSEEDLTRVQQELSKTYGKLNFAVHSIAFALREDLSQPFLYTSREGFRVALETSAYSFVAMCRMLDPILADEASIVSMTYLGSQRVLPGYNIMGVAKAALESSMRYLAYDLGTRGIRVNCVSPGPINTVSARGIKSFTDFLKKSEEGAPLKRPAQQEEVAAATVYLLSDMSRGITGQILYVDAGANILATL